MKTRFNLIDFSDTAALDHAATGPTPFWNAGDEHELRALVRKAVS